MKRLTAKFTIQLVAPIIFRGPGGALSYDSRVDDFTIWLSLVPDPGRRSKSGTERHWTYFCDEPALAITRDEIADPPSQREHPKERAAYFQQRLPAYSEVALRTLNNAITFFKYKLRQPRLQLVAQPHEGLLSPAWADEKGTVLDRGGRVALVQATPGLRHELGCKHLTRRQNAAVVSALTRAPTVHLHDEILADAQAAAFDGNIRRAVLELAVACEVFVKTWLFDPSERAGLVFEALENKRLVDVRVLDLLDVGSSTLGKRFRDTEKAAYMDIDHLFRARNKVAHRGEAHFHDDAGRRHVVDKKMLEKWWDSIGCRSHSASRSLA